MLEAYQPGMERVPMARRESRATAQQVVRGRDPLRMINGEGMITGTVVSAAAIASSVGHFEETRLVLAVIGTCAVPADTTPMDVNAARELHARVLDGAEHRVWPGLAPIAGPTPPSGWAPFLVVPGFSRGHAPFPRDRHRDGRFIQHIWLRGRREPSHPHRTPRSFRRVDAGYLARLVLEHRLSMAEAVETAIDLTYRLP
jgi:hypothetical protein